ncbi:hypothetical protein TNCV_594351 [Trichonephila clavipes]|nr:hypothetical protein TNCV_594351 [Trichonephila clavipes]
MLQEDQICLTVQGTGQKVRSNEVVSENAILRDSLTPTPQRNLWAEGDDRSWWPNCQIIEPIMSGLLLLGSHEECVVRNARSFSRRPASFLPQWIDIPGWAFLRSLLQASLPPTRVINF